MPGFTSSIEMQLTALCAAADAGALGATRATAMLQALQLLATLSASLFAGLYINVVEHPARMGLETRAAASQWAPSYKRATWMQAPLALVSLAAGVAAWWAGGPVGWLISGLTMGAVVVFTFIAIMPNNHKLRS